MISVATSHYAEISDGGITKTRTQIQFNLRPGEHIHFNITFFVISKLSYSEEEVAKTATTLWLAGTKLPISTTNANIVCQKITEKEKHQLYYKQVRRAIAIAILRLCLFWVLYYTSYLHSCNIIMKNEETKEISARSNKLENYFFVTIIYVFCKWLISNWEKKAVGFYFHWNKTK